MQQKSVIAALACTLLLGASLPRTNAQSISFENTHTATVFIANFNEEGGFTGWGSGFYVDEGIVITNRHVIEGSKYFRVHATETDNTVNLDCYKELTLSDVKINLNDDVAYMRAYLDCPHGVVYFTEKDPVIGQPISILGFPDRGTLTESMKLSTSKGLVTGTTKEGWLITDAYLHSGNSGGPVVVDGGVVGVAVAKGVDDKGNFVEGYFVPTSVIVKGLLYANDSTFGYTPRFQGQYSSASLYGSRYDPFDPPRDTRDATAADCKASIGEGSEPIGYGGCRCSTGYKRDFTNDSCIPINGLPTSASSSSSSSSRSSLPRLSSSSSSSQASSRSSSSVPDAETRVARIARRKAERIARAARIEERRKARLQNQSSQ